MEYSLFTNMDRCTPEEVQRLLLLVPDKQKEEALKFKHTFGQFATLESFLLLRQLLVENYQVDLNDPLDFVVGEHGKPSLRNHPHIHFNISHCPNAIAVAVDDAPIGVDVERYVNPSRSLLNYCMNERECQQVQESEYPERDFAALWTQKEALFKQRGTGITHELRMVLAHPHSDVKLSTETFDEQQFAFTLATAVR